MSTVFISYRREDTSGEARALSKDLAALLGNDSVFMDVDSISLGRDFRKVMQEKLGSCDLMLVLIGKNWVDGEDGSGTARLGNPEDFVRLEIEAALNRDIRITPLLIQGAQMPAPGSLPAEIRDLAFRHGFELSHNRWESDVRELVRRLGLDVRYKRQQKGSRQSTRLERKSGWLKAIAISGFAVTTASLVVFWWPLVDYDNLNEEASRPEAVNTESMGPVAYPETKLLVTAFQKELGLPADGIIGPLTQSALRTFQKERDIAADGKVGWETERALKAFLQERGRTVGRIIPDDEGAAVPTPQPSPYRPIAELAEMAKVARAVGLFISDDAGRCTSFLVEDGRAVVPAFCLPEAAETDRMRLRLDYNADDAPFRDVGIVRIEERDAVGLAVLALAEELGGHAERLSLRSRPPVPGEAVFMVHHPKAGPKQLSGDCYLDAQQPIAINTGTIPGVPGRDMLRFTCRSEGGSAGAPIVAAADGALLGVQVARRAQGFDQYGILISEFVKATAALR